MGLPPHKRTNKRNMLTEIVNFMLSFYQSVAHSTSCYCTNKCRLLFLHWFWWENGRGCHVGTKRLNKFQT